MNGDEVLKNNGGGRTGGRQGGGGQPGGPPAGGAAPGGPPAGGPPGGRGGRGGGGGIRFGADEYYLALLGTPFKFVDTDMAAFRAPPLLGEHTDEVLTTVLEMGPTDIEQLRHDGVVGLDVAAARDVAADIRQIFEVSSL